jgi:cytochrome P450
VCGFWGPMGSRAEWSRRCRRRRHRSLSYPRRRIRPGPTPAPDLIDLPYTGMVVKETLRLYPPVGRMGRRPLHDVDLGGVILPEDAAVFLSPFVTQRDPRWFPDPAVFRPERGSEPMPDRPPLFLVSLWRRAPVLYRGALRPHGPESHSGDHRPALATQASGSPPSEDSVIIDAEAPRGGLDDGGGSRHRDRPLRAQRIITCFSTAVLSTSSSVGSFEFTTAKVTCTNAAPR